MARVFRGSRAAVVVAAAIALAMMLATLLGCGSSYKSQVKDIIAELQKVQNEVLDETDHGGTAAVEEAREEDLSPREQYVLGLGSLREDVTEMSRAVALARKDLEVLMPSEATSLAFHEEYLRMLGEYGEALVDYVRLLEYQRLGVLKLGAVVPDASAKEGLWVALKGFVDGGVDESNIDQVAFVAEGAAGLVADVGEDWGAMHPPTGAIAEAHGMLTVDMEDLAEEFTRLAQTAAEAADSGSDEDLNEVHVLCVFAWDQLDLLGEAMDAWWVPVDAAFTDDAHALADLQDRLDALEATADEL